MNQAAIRQQAEACIQALQSGPRPRLLVTAGPTCEDIDPVRFITNRSSGRMGITIAEAACSRGWSVLLILGPTHLTPPAACTCLPVRSAADMAAAVLSALPWCDALVMAAAVADYTPAEPASEKRKKLDGDWHLRLQRTTDILAAVSAHPARPGKTIVGFALETSLDHAEARRKLEAKGLDAIVLNTTAAFAGDSTVASLLRADGTRQDLGRLAKSDLAEAILDVVASAKR